MSSSGVWANLEAIEGTVDGATDIMFKRKSREIQLTNDSGQYELEFRFNTSEEYATLKPTETITLPVWIRGICLCSRQGPSEYRIWVYG